MEPLQKQIAKVLEQKPNDAWALAHRGEIALEQGRLDDAIADVRRANQADNSPLNADLLKEALFSGLQQDFKKYRANAGELEQLLLQDREWAKYYRLTAVGLQQAGESSAALDEYLKLAAVDSEPDELEEIDSKLSILRQRWSGAI